MPVLVTSIEKPTFVAKPDMRFATTFLSVKFRDYAVKGESIMDKATGEIFTKRPADGRTVSFFQNKKYLHDIALRLRVLLSNNVNFTYDKTSESGYYISTDYDSMSILDEQRLDILTHDFIAPNIEEETTTQFKFNLSKKTNGFFFRCTTRDCDKALVEFLTHEYNERLETYSGDDPEYIIEHQKFIELEGWKLSNAVVEFTVKVEGTGATKVYTLTNYIRINEESCLYIPYQAITQDFPLGFNSILITIKAVHYDKIHFMINHLNEFGDEFLNNYNKFIYPDNEAYIDYYNVSYFIDNSTDLLLLGNEFIIALLETYYIRNLMMQLTSLQNPGDFRMSINRPDDNDFGINTIWAERVRDVYKGGIEVDNDTETDIKLMESVFSGVDYRPTIIQTDPTDIENFYIRDKSITSYTDEEIDGMLGNINTLSNRNIDNLVVMGEEGNLAAAAAQVYDEGMVVGTVDTTESSGE